MTEPNPYVSAGFRSQGRRQTEGQGLYQAYRGRARTIRVVSVLLLLFSLYLPGRRARGWSMRVSTRGASRTATCGFMHTRMLVAAGHREHAVLSA